MEQTLRRVRKQFMITAMVVATLCAVSAVLGLYVLAESRLHGSISAARVSQLARDNQEVSQYLASQQAYHAHFETIANLIRQEDRRQLSRLVGPIMVLVAGASALTGWWVARRLLRPVQEAYASQRRFMQDAAHELRNPLAALSTLTQQARRRPPTGAALRTYTDSLDRQAAQLTHITNDLLILEHPEAPGSAPVNAADLLRDVLEELHHLSITSGVPVNATIPPEVHARLEPRHFVLIAKNLIENAIKFSAPAAASAAVRQPAAPPAVTVTLTKKRQRLLLTVHDRGIGIPAAEIPHITQRFYRAKNTHGVEGTGLGMAIIARFAGLYNGEVTIMSNRRDGTRIGVSLDVG